MKNKYILLVRCINKPHRSLSWTTKLLVEKNFNISAEEFDKRLMFPNLDMWMSTKMSYIQLMKLLKSDPILKDENIFKKHYIAYIQLLGFYDRKRNTQLSGDDILSHIKNSLSTGNSIIDNLGYINKPVSHRFSVADVVGIKVYEAIKLLRQYINDDELIYMEVNNVFGI